MTTMQPQVLRAAAAALLLASAVGAQAAQPGYYAGAHGGRNDIDDWNATVSLSSVVRLPGSVSSHRGAHWGAFGGRQTEHFRFELEYQAGQFDLTQIQAGPLRQAVSTEGDYRALTANVYGTLDFGRIGVFAGAGAGWGRISLPSMSFASGCNCFPAASKDGFAYQGRAGAEWRITPQHNAFVQYTALRLKRPGSGSTPGVEYDRKTVGAWSAGYRFVF